MVYTKYSGSWTYLKPCIYLYTLMKLHGVFKAMSINVTDGLGVILWQEFIGKAPGLRDSLRAPLFISETGKVKR